MRVALVHDHLAQDGGAEQVLKIFTEIFPDAPIYTLLYDPKNLDKYKNRKINSSIIQKLPGGVSHYQWYLPFMPMAVEFFDLSEYDLVLSDASAFAKGVITSTDTVHICYCHTPTRYLWDYTHQYLNELKYNKFLKKIISLFFNYIRIWDRQASDRVDYFIANSYAVQKRIKKYYQKDSLVIYPPVEVEKFCIADKLDDYFLIGGRLAVYKRVDLVIEVFKKNALKLKVFGSGVDEERLKKLAKGFDNIEFLGRVSDEEKAKLYSHCQAFINPQEEDFGITVIEAMASGRPVIAYQKAGAKETVIDGKTGVFFAEQNEQSLSEAIEKFQKINFSSQHIRDYAKKFSVEIFKESILRFVEEKMKK